MATLDFTTKPFLQLSQTGFLLELVKGLLIQMLIILLDVFLSKRAYLYDSKIQSIWHSMVLLSSFKYYLERFSDIIYVSDKSKWKLNRDKTIFVKKKLTYIYLLSKGLTLVLYKLLSNKI